MRLHRPCEAAFALALLVSTAGAAPAQSRPAPPPGLSDSVFWDLFVRASEPDGHFSSENFVSNEIQGQEVLPTLLRTVRANGVYIGVGPEQNLTYIANLQPRLAVIIDIRRQNAMLHFMYRALFELSPTRTEFVERLFARPMHGKLPSTFTVKQLFEQCEASAPSDSAFAANRRAIVDLLTRSHHFALSANDLETIDYLYSAFAHVGPRINYNAGARGMNVGGLTRSAYATFAFLQNATTADGVQMAFLSADDRYRAVRDLESRNLVVPVVGDFGGPKAIRTVAAFLRDRALTVSAFYTSNVEEFLFGGRTAVADSQPYVRFYESVATLPIDSTSMFIRGVFRQQVPGSAWPPPQPGSGPIQGTIEPGAYAGTPSGAPGPATFIVDLPFGAGSSARVHEFQWGSGGKIMDWPGITPVTLFTNPGTANLINGVASLGATLASFRAGRLTSYADVTASTKATGWK